jgi:hypothetical protein
MFAIRQAYALFASDPALPRLSQDLEEEVNSTAVRRSIELSALRASEYSRAQAKADAERVGSTVLLRIDDRKRGEVDVEKLRIGLANAEDKKLGAQLSILEEANGDNLMVVPREQVGSAYLMMHHVRDFVLPFLEQRGIVVQGIQFDDLLLDHEGVCELSSREREGHHRHHRHYTN